MTIEQKNVLDIVSTSKDLQIVTFTISDHLDWENEKNHMLLIQDKINQYIASIESGELHEEYPNLKNAKSIEIEIIAKYELTETAAKFINQVKSFLADNGYMFTWKKYK